MLNRDSLFEPGIDKNAVSFIIYSPVISERLSYACEFIFNTFFKVNFSCSSDKLAFEQSDDFKINYSNVSIPGLVQIIPQKILFESAISDHRPELVMHQGMSCFYPNGCASKTCFHFDVFSAVFYMISRYEEWRDYEKDKHGRFEAKASILYSSGAHLKPVADIWCAAFGEFVEQSYGKKIFAPKKMKVISTIDVDNLFAFKYKSWLKSTGASLRDILNGDFKNILTRIKVRLNKIKDPFDVYEDLAQFCNCLDIPLVWFFLMRSGTANDRTVDQGTGAFEVVFKALKAKAAQIGLHPSYQSAFEKNLLATELSEIRSRSGENICMSRQHYLRFDIRSTPALLLQNGILADFTMGFASAPGFRAGTSHPFNYFDFSQEKKQIFYSCLFAPWMAPTLFTTVKIQIKPCVLCLGLPKKSKKPADFSSQCFMNERFMTTYTLVLALYIKSCIKS